jgi:hypothetical protein
VLIANDPQFYLYFDMNALRGFELFYPQPEWFSEQYRVTRRNIEYELQRNFIPNNRQDAAPFLNGGLLRPFLPSRLPQTSLHYFCPCNCR